MKKKSHIIALILLFFASTSLWADPLPPRYSEALNHYKESRFDQSLAVIRAVFDDNPGSYELRMLAAANYIGMNDFATALAHVNGLIREHPSRYEPRLLAAQLYRQRSQFRAARNQIAHAIRLAPQQLEPKIEQVRILYLQGADRAARDELNKLLESHRDDFRIVYLDGLLFLKQRQYDLAEFRFRNALRLTPDTRQTLTDLYNNLGLALIAQGELKLKEGAREEAEFRFRQAEEQLESARAINPDHPTVRGNLDYLRRVRGS